MSRQIFRPLEKCHLLHAADKIKDVLSMLKAGHGPLWEVPLDISEAYQDQIDSEFKRDVENKKTGQIKKMYVKIKENHLLDCKAMQTAAALMFGLIPVPEVVGEE